MLTQTPYQERSAAIGAVESPTTAALNDYHEALADLRYFQQALAERHQELGNLVASVEEARRLIETAGTFVPRLEAAIRYADVVTTEVYEVLHDTEPRECYGPAMDVDPELPREVYEERADLAIVQIEQAAARLEEDHRSGMAQTYTAIADALRSVVLDDSADAEAVREWTAAAVGAIAILNRAERRRA